MKWKGALILLGGLTLGLSLGFLVYVSGGHPATGAGESVVSAPPTVGAMAPDFDLPLLNGGQKKLSSLRGKPVVINFWATWCLPCKEEMPLLEKYAAKYSDRLVVLGVNSGEAESLIQPYTSELGISFPILLDHDERVTDQYFVRNFPITFFVDGQGIIRGQSLGLLQENLLVRYLKTIGIEP